MSRLFFLFVLLPMGLTVMAQEIDTTTVMSSGSSVVYGKGLLEYDVDEPEIVTFGGFANSDSFSYKDGKLGLTNPIHSYRSLGMDVGYSNSGMLYQVGGVDIFGSSSGSSLIGLLDRRSATLGASRSFGRFMTAGFVEANKYHVPFATRDQFGVGGRMTYRFSDALSMTVFGQYYNTNPYFSMAAFPEVNTTSFGGYFSIDGKRAGIDLGVERRYDPFSRSFITQPIVTPKYKFSDNFKIEVPVGGLLQHCFENMFKINRQSDPNIMPGMIR